MAGLLGAPPRRLHRPRAGPLRPPERPPAGARHRRLSTQTSSAPPKTGPDVGDLVGLPERVEEQLSDVPARCLAFNRWGTLLAAGCAHGAVAVYDYQTRGVAALLEGGHAPDTDVAAVLWSGDGRVLLSGGRDGSVTAWDVATGRVRQRLRLTSPGVVTHLAWVSGEVQHLLAGGQEDEVLVSRSGGPAVLLRLSNCHEQQLPVVCIGGLLLPADA